MKSAMELKGEQLIMCACLMTHNTLCLITLVCYGTEYEQPPVSAGHQYNAPCAVC